VRPAAGPARRGPAACAHTQAAAARGAWGCRRAGEFKCEGPNNRLYQFDGTLVLENESIPIGPNQILLRVRRRARRWRPPRPRRHAHAPRCARPRRPCDLQGSQLRNASWIFGLVIYTGHESKLLRNATSAPIKKSRLERMVNQQIKSIFVLLFVMATICVIGYVIWVRRRPPLPTAAAAPAAVAEPTHPARARASVRGDRAEQPIPSQRVVPRAAAVHEPRQLYAVGRLHHPLQHGRAHQVRPPTHARPPSQSARSRSSRTASAAAGGAPVRRPPQLVRVGRVRQAHPGGLHQQRPGHVLRARRRARARADLQPERRARPDRLCLHRQDRHPHAEPDAVPQGGAPPVGSRRGPRVLDN